MPLVNAKEMLTKAKAGHYAVGQFNINNLEWTKSILLTAEEQDVLDTIHRQLRGLKSDEITEEIIKIFTKTRNNREFLDYCKKIFARR